jgi:CheY-like chemotaxis protein
MSISTPPASSSVMHHRIILHVDDDQDDRFLVSSILNSLDPSIKVLEAENGLKAIEILRKVKITGELPSLVILDYNMPLMNGMETYKEIRKHPELVSVPVVLLTTFSSRRDDDYWENERVATFTKPATFSELTTSIQKILSYCHSLSV